MHKFVLMALTTGGYFPACLTAQNPQNAQIPPSGTGAFQRLPPMVWHAAGVPISAKAPAIEAQVPKPATCAIPLLNATPDNSKHYAIREAAPLTNQVGAMVYAKAAPICDGTANQGPARK
jgi:hypothetical protein